MEKIISYPISIIYYFFFGLWLLIFHPIQIICLRVFGYNAHRWSVAILNLFLVRTTHILGTTYKIRNKSIVPKNVPVVFVSNHQSLYDIPPYIWFFRQNHPKFISKKELGKGIPSVSYNLQYGGSALIDRKDARQAIPAIAQVAQYINDNNFSVVIFPEGTRSKTGKTKEFSTNGLKTIYKNAPDAYFVPVTVNNSFKMAKWGFFPLGLGNRLDYTFHEPLKVSEHTFEEILAKSEAAVNSAIK